jgi:hypothetical protein
MLHLRDFVIRFWRQSSWAFWCGPIWTDALGIHFWWKVKRRLPRPLYTFNVSAGPIQPRAGTALRELYCWSTR